MTPRWNLISRDSLNSLEKNLKEKNIGEVAFVEETGLYYCFCKDGKFEVIAEFTKEDKGKPRFSLIPTVAIRQLIAVLEHGAQKYGKDNWQGANTPEGLDRYYCAMQRHMLEWQEGNNIDKDSGIHHMAHVMANAAFILALQLRGGK